MYLPVKVLTSLRTLSTPCNHRQLLKLSCQLPIHEATKGRGYSRIIETISNICESETSVIRVAAMKLIETVMLPISFFSQILLIVWDVEREWIRRLIIIAKLKLEGTILHNPFKIFLTNLVKREVILTEVL